jgi:hypothetical protein
MSAEKIVDQLLEAEDPKLFLDRNDSHFKRPPYAGFKDVFEEVRLWPEYNGDYQDGVIDFWKRVPLNNGYDATWSVSLVWQDNLNEPPTLMRSFGFENVDEWYELEDMATMAVVAPKNYEQINAFLLKETDAFIAKLRTVAQFK